jgi:serine/threonine protein kinase/Tfp pilus assembly protein PilF
MGIMASQEQTVEQLFGAALDRRPEDRRAFLDQVCAGAPELRQRVEELLLADEQAGSFLERKLLVSNANQSLGARSSLTTTGGRFETGQSIAGRFAVVRFIARGGMGEVYEVEDHFLQGVHVALKVILPHIARDAASSHRFEREVLLARKVTHPNLCPIYDISHCDEPAPPFLFLTMKLLSGETLSSRLQRSPLLSRTEIISIFRQMIAGLTAIHVAGVIHRDIKPNNVMLDQSGSDLCLSIMDFGLARLYESETTALTHGFIAGTPGYLAPELLTGSPPSQATDIFALGVLFQRVLTVGRPNVESRGISSKPFPALESADVPPIFIHSVKEFLSEDPARRCDAFKLIQSRFELGGSVTERILVGATDDSHHRVLTRRNFVIGSAVTACAAAGGVVWKWDRIDDLVHPIPRKRFVALLDWPPPSDARFKPMLNSVIDAIASELSRAEAFDQDLFVIAQKTLTDITTPKELNEFRESLGANLVLAASGMPIAKDLHLTLSLLDAAATRPLREKQIRIRSDQQISLADKAIRAAAELLDITHYKPNAKRTRAGTDNPEAYAAFQAAEALRKQDNDTGLNAAIEKYKQAIEIDPHYAVAQTKLSWAYLRSYGLHGDPAAMNLARENCESALALDPNLVEAHLGLAWIDQEIGQRQDASHEISKALSLDPSNPHTLIYQARFYALNGHYAEAEATFSRVLKLRPNYWLAHNELGVILNDQGKYPQALMEFRSASIAAPRNALAFNNIGSIYLQQGKLDEAIENLKTSFDLETNDAAAKSLASALRLRRKYAEAIEYAQQAVKLNPSEPGHWLELGDCYSAAQKFHLEAIAAYKRAAEVQEEQLRTQPKNGPAWMLMALCRVKAGTPANAFALITKAESLNADDMDSQLYKVRTLELLGRRDDALNNIARCLKRGATVFQFQSMPDLETIRTDPRYSKILEAGAPATATAV